MIVCPNCNHPNPDGAIQCEACYTPLPSTTSCPNCGAPVQVDANFCGQCGSNLQASPAATAPDVATAAPTSSGDASEFPGIPSMISMPDIPDLPDIPDMPDLIEPEPLVLSNPLPQGIEIPETPPAPPPAVPSPPPITPPQAAPFPPPPPPTIATKTQIQQQFARLLHVQTNTTIELPQNLSIIHIGKQNDRIPPDVDVSGFPDSEIVSRIHADIRIEGDAYYLEDVGSSNGTYVNNIPLPMGNRHRLRPGDRISLGKGDRVTFLFQLS